MPVHIIATREGMTRSWENNKYSVEKVCHASTLYCIVCMYYYVGLSSESLASFTLDSCSSHTPKLSSSQRIERTK